MRKLHNLETKKRKTKTKKISLVGQINKVIGHRILFFSIIFMIIIFGLTIYDLSISIKQLHSRINEKIKPVEAFVMNQAMIDNLETVELKIESFNESNPTFQIKWMRQGKPFYNTINWHFPFSWEYDYPVETLAGFQFGYFKLTGGFLSDKTLLYDLLFRLSLLIIFAFSVLIILYPLAKKIPEQLFINPINRFIDLVSNNSTPNKEAAKSLPAELEVLETKILSLLKMATEHERNKAAIELGHLSARLAHDIYSPLAAMEIGLSLLTKKIPRDELAIFVNGIQSVRDIANNVLDRYRNPGSTKKPLSFLGIQENSNLIRPVLLFSLVEVIISQKQHEWHQQPCKIILTVAQETKIAWINMAPSEVKRLLSNLFNNAYEAFNEKKEGIIHATIKLLEGKLQLQLHDNGIGIPAEKINCVLNGTSLKHCGKGLGLSGAKQFMENSGGKLEISSTLAIGTKINLFFPCIEHPTWFPSSISLFNITTAVVLDDDLSILMYWQERISKVGLCVKIFSTYESASKWLESNQNLIPRTLFLADYELSEDTNGLMFLEKIKNNDNRYLITSHAEELRCQNAAEKASVWLIPKSLIAELKFIPAEPSY